MNVHNNTTFANLEAELLMNNNAGYSMTNIIIQSNIFVAKTTATKVIWCNTVGAATMPTPFTSDSNYFARPIDDNLTVQTYVAGGAITQRTLAGWQALNGQDAHSKKSPQAISDTNNLRFEYNATTSNRVVSLDKVYMGMNGALYSGSLTLNPYSSIVLINTGVDASGSNIFNFRRKVIPK